MITRLKDFVKYKLNESTTGRTLEDYFKEKGITLVGELTVLRCSYNDLTSLKGIENCTKLTHLNCRDNKLTSLEGIENLTNLTELYCTNNNLISLKGIENCNSLTELYCTSNNLTSLEGIENLTRLTELSCHTNNLPFNNYDGMSVIEIKDSFYLVEHELEISSILCNITDDYNIDRQGFMYEFEGGVILTADLLKELKVVYKKLKMIGIITYATIGNKMHSIEDIKDIKDIYLNEYISKIHLKLK